MMFQRFRDLAVARSLPRYLKWRKVRHHGERARTGIAPERHMPPWRNPTALRRSLIARKPV